MSEWIGIISGFLIGLGGLYLKFRIQLNAERDKRAEAEKNMELANESLKASDFKLNFSKFRRINHILDKIVATSKTDRALTLTALNINNEIGTCAVIMSSPHDENGLDQEDIYQDIEIDETYRRMLHTIKIVGFVLYKVSEMPRGLLRDIYEAEGVRFSMVVWGTEIKINDSASLWLYFSFATYTEDQFDIQLQLRIQSEKNRIISIINSLA